MSFWDWLFPNYACLICKDELNAHQNLHICDKCAQGLPINNQSVTLADKSAHQWFDKSFSAFIYEEPICSLILALKYNNHGQVAKFIAPYMAGAILREGAVDKDTILIPVPLCKKRYKRRGYNQAELLAREVAIYIGCSVDKNILERIKVTSVQKNMNVKQRQENLDGAFAVNNCANVQCNNFILVDDVFTSGSTVNECAKALKEAGAGQVDALVCARVGMQ